jgi:hypothetical protein
MPPLETVLEDASGLFTEAATLLRRVRGVRQEFGAMTATGADEPERIVHGGSPAGSRLASSQGSRRRSGG